MTINLILDFVKYSELIAAIFGTIYFSKYRNTALKFFLYLLWFITLTEFLSWYSMKYGINELLFIDDKGVRYNWWMYNLLRFITFNCLFFIYYKYLKTKIYKRWIRIFMFIYIISSVINWSFLQSFIWNNSEMPRTIGSIFLIVTILFYFIELLKSEKVLVFHRLLLFWISVGLLLYYAGTIPFYLKLSGYALIPGIHKLFLIVYILAIIMYLTFTFGFIWSKKE